MLQKRIKFLKQYINFRKNSKPRGGHGIHSPFVYDLYTQSIDTKNKAAIFDRIEALRKALCKNQSLISKRDLGAGSRNSENAKITIGEIAKRSTVPPYMGRLLFRLVNYFKPDTIIELGTSLGVSASYLAAGYSKSRVISIEGDETLVKLANENLNKLGLTNVTVSCGDFDTKTPELLNEVEKLGIVFIDGNHTEEATWRYFKLFSERADNDTLIIFDDIRWSEGMQRTWRNICDDLDVTLSMDLFNCGLVFFNKGLVKQHFNLRYGPL